jgi:hypothetical protein
MNTSISIIINKMLDNSEGNLHDINHFLKVYAYAKTIGELEQLDDDAQYVLEVAAVLHDIACPLCRDKYGKAEGRMQEIEGETLSRAFLDELNISEALTQRIVWLVSHHHTYSNVTRPEHQILLEADYLVNADESAYSKENIKSAETSFFRTKTGVGMLESIYLKAEN